MKIVADTNAFLAVALEGWRRSAGVSKCWSKAMKVYTYSQARQRLSEVLDTARREEVFIRRRGGDTFSLRYKMEPRSPFDVPGIKTRATTEDILAAVRESRERE